MKVVAGWALAGLVTAAAGCGSPATPSAADRYAAQVNQVQRSFAAQVQGFAGALTPSSSARQDRITLAGFQGALRRATSQLRAIVPPAAVASLHRQLVGVMNRYGDAISLAQRALGAHRRGALLETRQRLLGDARRAAAQLNSTIDAINSRLHP
ncbi:MAG TPA: hypothetical protein VGN69_11340 [Solirubrobacteraceae bacterium]|nr:hypothetical protein [Solirubrobacteraceae bacterium]